MAKLFIICGHGETDPGACANSYQEAERVRELAKKIKEYGGDNVIIGDTSKNWYSRSMVTRANIPTGSLVLELHMDSAASTARGGHVIISDRFAADVYDIALSRYISGIFPGRSEIISKRGNLRNVNMAANNCINYRLLECCFISNAYDLAIFNKKIDDIAKGILKAFGIKASEKEYNVILGPFNKEETDRIVNNLTLEGYKATIVEA